MANKGWAILTLLMLLLLVHSGQAQTLVIGNEAYNVRFGAADPATCNADRGEVFFNTTTDTLKVCTAANTWTATGGGASTTKWDFAAAGCNQSAAGPGFNIPTSNGPVANCYGTSPHRYGGLDFADGASALTATLGPITLPSFSTLDVKSIWLCSSGTCSTNNFVITYQTVCVADTEDLANPTYNAAQTTTKAGSATTNARLSATLTGLTMTGCAAGESLFLRFGRDPTNGSDTQAGTMTLTDIEITVNP